MKKITKILACALFALSLAAVIGCSKDDDETTNSGNGDITAHFDPKFAAELEKGGYIPNAKKIMPADVANITYVYVCGPGLDSKGELTSLAGIEYFSALEILKCYYNQLTSLDVSKCKALKELHCDGNQLASLNVRGCTALTELECYDNELTSLDVSGCIALTSFDFTENRLTSLNTSGCMALTSINCSGNQLVSLDVSGCMALTSISCSGNQLSSAALNALFESLCNKSSDYESNIYIGLNPGTNTCDRSIATNKGWSVYDLYNY